MINNDTKRPLTNLPRILEEESHLLTLKSYNMVKTHIDGSNLVIENDGTFEKMLSDGFFLLKIPNNINLEFADLLCNNFYLPKAGTHLDLYRGYRDIQINAPFQGYFDRENDQWENLYIEYTNWKKFLPDTVSQVGIKMCEIGIIVLKNVLNYLKIPKNKWSLLTSGLTDFEGHKMLAFNHFRSDKNLRGTKFHRDSGWVTVLRSMQPGLVALINKKPYLINPLEGYFIINFGSSIEVLTEQLETPVKANIHGVIKTSKTINHQDRISYVTFLDSDLEGNIYKYINGNEVLLQTMKDFAIQEVSRTYDNNDFEL